jgi:hypothetical protein
MSWAATAMASAIKLPLQPTTLIVERAIAAVGRAIVAAEPAIAVAERAIVTAG